MALDAHGGGERPSDRLPLRQLLAISIYWLGINAVAGAVFVQALPAISVRLLGEELGPSGFGIVAALGGLVAIAVQPTVGAISDHTITRWGRRKPYIAIGGTLDVLVLLGIALSNDFLVLAAFVLLLQFSANFAQGPFQGYVPDLVPGPQVGLASGLMGLMSVLGIAVGVAAVSATSALYESAGVGLNGPYGLALVGVGLIQLVTAWLTIVTVREGRAAVAREGRTWSRIARSAWGTDILRERSYVWLLASRLVLLLASSLMINSALYYMERTLGYTTEEAHFWVFVAGVAITLATAIAVVPSGLLSNRVGRKRTINASAVLGLVGMLIVGFSPSIEVTIAGAMLVGIGAGTFLAVDWALMTDIIPKATSGRYMGISNVATGLGASLLPGLLAGIVITAVSIAVGEARSPLGPRVAVLLAVPLFLLGMALLRPVDERRREDRPDPLLGDPVPASGRAA